MATEANEKTGFIPAEQAQHCESWQMPSLESSGRVVSVASRGNAVGRQASTRPEPLTASKLDAIRKAAYEEGLEMGKRDGLRLAQTEVNEKIAQLNRMMGQLMHPLAEQEAELEQALVQLAGRIAEAVVQSSYTPDEQHLSAIVKQALEQLPEGSERIRVLLHPRDAELLKKACADQSDGWKILADASLVSGGCIVKTDYSYVDYSLQKQFALTLAETVRQTLTPGAEGAPA